jgi:hypothetical protein
MSNQAAKFWRIGNTILLAQPSLVAMIELYEGEMLWFSTAFYRRCVGTGAANGSETQI